MRPCTCDHCGRGRPYQQGECLDCWRYHNTERYKKLWDKPGEFTRKKTVTTVVNCSMLGAEVKSSDGQTATTECQSCGGKTKLKLFHCQHPAREPDQVTMKDCQHCSYKPRDVKDGRALILKNWLSPGDVLAMTAAIYSLHRKHPDKFITSADTSCQAIFENNPDVVSLDQAKAMNAEVMEMHYPAVNECNQRGIHFMEAYCEYLEDALKVRVPLLTNKPMLYLSRRETTWISQVQEITGNNKPYWIVNAGVKRDYTAKQWPWFQEMIDKLQGRIQFVQIGKNEHDHRGLRGVINLLGKTEDRQLIRLVSHCAGVVCGTTFLMHLAAAFQKPGVILAGGREPRQWNQYPGQILLSTVGFLPCCKRDACWKSRTVKLGDGDQKDNELCENPTMTVPPSPKCMAIISPEEVADKILLTTA